MLEMYIKINHTNDFITSSNFFEKTFIFFLRKLDKGCRLYVNC